VSDYLLVPLCVTGNLLHVAGFVAFLRAGNVRAFFRLCAAACWVLFGCAIAADRPVLVTIQAAGAAFFTWLWWLSGGGRGPRKALRQVGAKSAARIKALTQRIHPSPVPSPAPQ
jgi:hypothetical protein